MKRVTRLIAPVWMALWMVLCLSMLAGCGDDSAESIAQQADVAEDAPDRFWEERRSQEAYFPNGGFLLKRSIAGVVNQLLIRGTEEGTTALGFNLDGKVSEDGEEQSCGHGDLADFEGTAGVDNQFAKVWDIIELLVGEQVDALLLEAINEGRFLLIIELSEVDDLVNDDNVTLTLMRGKLQPQVGASGHLLPSQTYEIDRDFPISQVTGAAIVNGVVDAGPVEVRVPIEIFDADFVLGIGEGRVRLEIDPETGEFTGVLGGGVHVADTMAELLSTGASAEAEAIKPFLENNADMGKVDGVCELLSAGIGFVTTAGFVVHYPDE